MLLESVAIVATAWNKEEACYFLLNVVPELTPEEAKQKADLLFSFECCLQEKPRGPSQKPGVNLLFSFECCRKSRFWQLVREARRASLLFSFECCPFLLTASTALRGSGRLAIFF